MQKTFYLSGETNLTKKKVQRVELDYLDWAMNGHLLTDAIPLLLDAGGFFLLCFHPEPVRSSLTNLDNSDSSMLPIVTTNLMRTPDRYRATAPRNPDLKPSKHPSLQVTRFRRAPLRPADCVRVNFNYWFFRFTLVPRKGESEMVCESYETLTWVDILSF